MVTLRMKVMVCFQFGRKELALIRPKWKHDSRAKPSILSKGFIMFLSYSTTAIRPIRQIRGKTKKKHPEDRLLAGLK